MIRNISYKIEVSPLIILHFPLLAPRKFLDAQIFNLRFSDPSEMTQIADKLRWYRYRHALLQSEVADRIGIDQKTYMRYEEYGRDYYPIEHMQSLPGCTMSLLKACWMTTTCFCTMIKDGRSGRGAYPRN